MGLVDGEQRQQAALVQRVELGQEARCGDALGRGVEQRELVRASSRARRARRRRSSSVELRNAAWTPASSSAPTWSCISAISGLTDDGHAVAGAMPRDRRHLVAQALAAAGGHQHQRVAAGDRRARRSLPAGRGTRRSRRRRAGRRARHWRAIARCRQRRGHPWEPASYASESRADSPFECPQTRPISFGAGGRPEEGRERAAGAA